jgi:hypothetical protein
MELRHLRCLISDEQFEEATHTFVPPTDAEGFNIIRH